MKLTQCERIMRHMEDYGSITSAEAISEYGIYRLASRISDLRRQGVPIKREFRHSRNRYGEPVSFAAYSLVEEINIQ